MCNKFLGDMAERIKVADYDETVELVKLLRKYIRNYKCNYHIWALVDEVLNDEFEEGKLEFIQKQLIDYLNLMQDFNRDEYAVKIKWYIYRGTAFALFVLILVYLMVLILSCERVILPNGIAFFIYAILAVVLLFKSEKIYHKHTVFYRDAFEALKREFRTYKKMEKLERDKKELGLKPVM